MHKLFTLAFVISIVSATQKTLIPGNFLAGRTKISSSMVQLSQTASDLSQDINELTELLNQVLSQINSETNATGENYLTLDSQVTNLKERVSQLESDYEDLESRTTAVEGEYVTVEQVLDYIKLNGLSLGERWFLNEEMIDDSEALVFRDTLTEGDYRYSMYPGKKVDL